MPRAPSHLAWKPVLLYGGLLAIVSTGPDRDHTIVLQDPFA